MWPREVLIIQLLNVIFLLEYLSRFFAHNLGYHRFKPVQEAVSNDDDDDDDEGLFYRQTEYN